MAGEKPLRVYASPETHSSIDKAVRIAGIGQQHLVKVPTDGSWALDPEALRAAIEADLAAGLLPAGVVLCIGGTSVGASDRLRESHRGGTGARPLRPRRRRLGRFGHDLSRAAGVVGRRRGGRQYRLQSPQVARRAVRLLDPVSGGPGTAGPDPRGPSGLPARRSARARSRITVNGPSPWGAGSAPSSSGFYCAPTDSRISASASGTTSPGPRRPPPPSPRWTASA